MPPCESDAGIGRWLERRADLSPGATALVHRDTPYSYAELASRVRRLAHALSAHGVGRGDRVVWIGANHPAFLELLFATAQLGAVLAPVNHRFDRDVVRSLVDRYDARAVVIGPGAGNADRVAGERLRIAVDGAAGGDIEFEHLLAGGRDQPIDIRVDAGDLCLLPHTSGTTGRPKGVMLTHGNVTWNAINLLTVADLRSDDVTIAVAPLFRSGGVGVNVLPVLFKGGTVVVPETNGPLETLELIERHGVTVGFANPDLLQAIVDHDRWRGADLSSVRFFVTGGAPVPERLIRAYQDRGVTFLQGYGLSEAAPVVALLDQASPRSKAGSAGKPPLFVDIRVTRPDGSDADRNEIGELVVRGPNVMAGYWRDPAATDTAIDEHGWLHTGDAARIDVDGYLWIVDRITDGFDVDGCVVFPGEVERVLMEHPDVTDAAVAWSNGRATAFVVGPRHLAARLADVLSFCGERLPSHAVPASIRVIDQVPRSSVGKIVRRNLVALLDAPPGVTTAAMPSPRTPAGNT